MEYVKQLTDVDLVLEYQEVLLAVESCDFGSYEYDRYTLDLIMLGSELDARGFSKEKRGVLLLA